MDDEDPNWGEVVTPSRSPPKLEPLPWHGNQEEDSVKVNLSFIEDDEESEEQEVEEHQLQDVDLHDDIKDEENAINIEVKTTDELEKVSLSNNVEVLPIEPEAEVAVIKHEVDNDSAKGEKDEEDEERDEEEKNESDESDDGEDEMMDAVDISCPDIPVSKEEEEEEEDDEDEELRMVDANEEIADLEEENLSDINSNEQQSIEQDIGNHATIEKSIAEDVIDKQFDDINLMEEENVNGKEEENTFDSQEIDDKSGSESRIVEDDVIEEDVNLEELDVVPMKDVVQPSIVVEDIVLSENDIDKNATEKHAVNEDVIEKDDSEKNVSEKDVESITRVSVEGSVHEQENVDDGDVHDFEQEHDDEQFMNIVGNKETVATKLKEKEEEQKEDEEELDDIDLGRKISSSGSLSESIGDIEEEDIAVLDKSRIRQEPKSPEAGKAKQAREALELAAFYAQTQLAEAAKIHEQRRVAHIRADADTQVLAQYVDNLMAAAARMPAASSARAGSSSVIAASNNT